MSMKSRKKISKSLLQLMETSDISQITIAEICGWSKISRGTFYNNYSTKEDVVRDVCRFNILDYCENFASQKDTCSYDTLFTAFLENRKHSEFLFLLKSQNLLHIQRDELFKICSSHDNIIKQKYFDEIPLQERKYYILAHISSFLAIYEAWADNGFIETIEEITKIYLNIVIPNQSLIARVGE